MLLFSGIRCHLSGFDRAQECKFTDDLELHGGKVERNYSPECTHVIVSEHTYDDPVCAAARKDGKALVTKDWVKDCLSHSALMDTSSVLYMPVRDPSGIPGCKNFCMCLTGYTGQVRKKIEKMVLMMGANFSKPLVAHQVTHLICYKFEGDKHKFGIQLGLKIVNHRWLEDCLRHWKVMDEKNYSISGWELEQAEAKELEAAKTRAQEAAKAQEEAAKAQEEAAKAHEEAAKAQEQAAKTPAAELEVVEVQAEPEPAGNKPDDMKPAQGAPEATHVDMEAEAEAKLQQDEERSSEKPEKNEKKKRAASFDSEATTQQYDIEDEGENCGSTAANPQHESQQKIQQLPEELPLISTATSDKSSPSLNKRKSSTPLQTPGTSSKRHAGAPSAERETTATSLGFETGSKSPTPGNDQPPEPEKKKAELPVPITIEDEEVIPVIQIDASESKKTSSSRGSKGSKGKALEAEIEELLGRRRGKGKEKGPRKNKGRGRPRIFPKDIETGEENRRHFAVSGHTQEKKKLTGIIRRLYGHVCRDDHSWKENTTHIVIPELRRTEKFLAALASGIWILKAEYIEASDKAGKFLDEEEYEWYGSGTAEEGRIELQAPRKWRLEKQKTGCGAFEGLRVVIYGECILPPLATLKRGIKAGGGTVLATSPPYRQHLVSGGIDFAIIAVGIPQDDPTVVELLKSKVACVRDEYFVELICTPSTPLQKHILFNTGAAVEKALQKLEKTKASPPKKKTWGQGAAGAAGKLDESGDEDEDEEDQACCVCKRKDHENVMLLCDGCNTATHTFCCVPPLEEVPAEDWFCIKCLAARNESSKF